MVLQQRLRIFCKKMKGNIRRRLVMMVFRAWVRFIGVQKKGISVSSRVKFSLKRRILYAWTAKLGTSSRVSAYHHEYRRTQQRTAVRQWLSFVKICSKEREHDKTQASKLLVHLVKRVFRAWRGYSLQVLAVTSARLSITSSAVTAAIDFRIRSLLRAWQTQANKGKIGRSCAVEIIQARVLKETKIETLMLWKARSLSHRKYRTFRFRIGFRTLRLHCRRQRKHKMDVCTARELFVKGGGTGTSQSLLTKAHVTRATGATGGQLRNILGLNGKSIGNTNTPSSTTGGTHILTHPISECRPYLRLHCQLALKRLYILSRQRVRANVAAERLRHRRGRQACSKAFRAYCAAYNGTR